MPSPSALSTFATVGLAVAITYLLASTALGGFNLIRRTRREVRTRLPNAPGAFVSREIDSIDRRIRRHSTAVLLFAVCVGVLVGLGRPDAGPELHPLGLVAIAVLVTATGVFAIAKGAQLLRYRSRLQFLLEADLGVARRLDEVRLRGHRVYHAVAIGDRIIDHVVVGALGVFAAQLVLPTRPGAVSVSLVRGSLLFGPGHGEFRLQPVTVAFARLARELGRVVGHPVKVVPTLIAPGCTVETRDDERYLLTNEQNCVTLVGWKDSEAYLMDDEIIRIADWLSARSQPQRQWAWRLPRAALHVCVRRPGLV